MSDRSRIVYMVGVDHRIQYTNDSCGPQWSSDIRQFEDYLVNKAGELSADLIAEEFSEALISLNNASSITARNAARRANVGHLFMDPDLQERAELNITSNDQRENEWLSRISRVKPHSALVLVGGDHLNSFADKLRAAGYTVEELSRNWGTNWMTRN